MSSMFRRLATRSVPATPRSSSTAASAAAESVSCKEQQLNSGRHGCNIKPTPLVSSAAQHFGQQQSIAAPTMQNNDPQGNSGVNLMPLETVLPLLDGYAKNLLLDKARRIQLKSKCMGTFVKELNSEKDDQNKRGASILNSAHTVLTYMSWAIQHFEKAAAGMAASSTAADDDDQQLNGELLDKAERMLGTLAESMDRRGFTAEVPNAHLLGLAYIYLALIWKLRRTIPSPRASVNKNFIASSIKCVATHLLEMFIVCPKYARLCYAPELWGQLFKPSLSGVESWYRKEYHTITNYTRSLSAVIRSSPCSPTTQEQAQAQAQQKQQQQEQEHQLADANLHTSSSVYPFARRTDYSYINTSARLTNTSRAKALPHLQSHRHPAVTINKREEKIKMQISLLYDLYEETLDEGTQDYALHYQEQIMGFDIKLTDRVGSVQLEYGNKHKSKSPQLQHQYHTANPTGQDSRLTLSAVKGQHSIETMSSKDHVANAGIASDHHRRFTWLSPTKSLQFRRTLHNTIFGALFTPDKTGKEAQSPSFMRFCNNELPNIRPYQDIPPSIAKSNTSRSSVSRYCPQPVIEEESGSTADDDTISYASAAADLRPNSGYFNKQSSIISDNHNHVVRNFIADHKSPGVRFSDVDQTPPDSICNENRNRTDTGRGRSSKKRLIDLMLTADQQRRSTASQGTSLISLTNIMESWDTKEAASRPNFHQSTHSSTECTPSVASTSIPNSRTRRSSFSTAEKTLREKLLMEHQQRSGLLNKEHNMLPPEGNIHGLSIAELRKSSSIPTKSSRNSNIRSSNAPPAAVKGREQKKLVQKKLLAVGDEKDELPRLVQELHAIVADAREFKVGVDRCEEILLRLSQTWLECNAAAAAHARAVGTADPLVPGKQTIISSSELVNDLLYILATSELPEAQRLSLCLLSTSIAACNKKLNMHQSDVKAHKQVPTILVDPNILCEALSHLLNQHSNRLPEAALLLHLLHPSLACSHLPQLLPLLLDIAQRTTSSELYGTARSSPEEKGASSRFPEAQLPPRALALKIASQLLGAADLRTRQHSCKHILFPNALPCLLRSLDSHNVHLDECVAAASILTICIQTHPDSRQCILKAVSASSAVLLLQRTACSMGSFKTAIDFVAELMFFNRMAQWTQVMQSVQREGLFNCIHALMAYIQTAPLEHQPAAAVLLLHMDLLSARDHRRYSVFREEAMDSIVAALSSGNKEASLNAARTLLRMSRAGALLPAPAAVKHLPRYDQSGCISPDQDQGLEAWLLSKAGLGTQHHTEEQPPAATVPGPSRNADADMNCTPQDCGVTSKDVEDSECCGAISALDSWERKVVEALLGYGEPLMWALAKGLQSSGLGELRRACLVVATWLSCYLGKSSSSSSSCPVVEAPSVTSTRKPLQAEAARKVKSNSGQMMRVKEEKMKGVMREALESELEAIAVGNMGTAIEERVFAALALQNLLSSTTEDEVEHCGGSS